MATEKGKGFLFPNGKATPDNKQPHLTGEAVTPKGETIRIAAWTNKSKRGDELAEEPSKYCVRGRQGHPLAHPRGYAC